MRDPSSRDQYSTRGDSESMYTRNHSRDKYYSNRGEEPYTRNTSRNQYGSAIVEKNRLPRMQPPGAEENAINVTLSLDSLRGIVVQESSKRAVRGKVYDSATNQDGVRVMITALVPEENIRGFNNIKSEPLETAETKGRKKFFKAIFPLNERKDSSSITIAGLIQGEQMYSPNSPNGHTRLKAKPFDLLISLVHQNEEICVGKATILATGEEIRTKQIDLPIDAATSS